MGSVVRPLLSVGRCLRRAWHRATQRVPKSLRFALVGAVGCLGGAMVGEGLLTVTRSAATTNTAVGPRSICLVIDSSGSMQGSKLAEVQAAAKNFVQRQDQSRNQFAVVQFAFDAKLLAGLGTDVARIGSAIDHMKADGATAMHLGLRVAEEELSAASPPRHVLLFTDGVASWPPLALAAAQQVRNRGNQIIAIGTDDADRGFLSRVTGDHRLVLWAASGQFEAAFHAAEKLIASASLLDASSGYDWARGLARTGGWTALLALGLGASLIAAQNRYLRHPLFSQRDLLIGVGGCIAAGLLAGSAGQGLFWLARSDALAGALGPILLATVLGVTCAFWVGLTPQRTAQMAGVGAFAGLLIAIGTRWLWSHLSSWYWLPTILALPAWGGIGALLLWIASRRGTRYVSARALRAAAVAGVVGRILLFFVETYLGEVAMLLTDATTRMIGWSILGSTLGLGLSLFIPNLNRRHALIAGAASGIAGAALYLTVGIYLGGFSARIIGALALGFSMGLMIVIAEAACREHWLEVAYSPNDRRTINLGTQAVTIGGNMISQRSNVQPQSSTALTYRVDKDAVVCQDATTGRVCRVLPGQTK